MKKFDSTKELSTIRKILDNNKKTIVHTAKPFRKCTLKKEVVIGKIYHIMKESNITESEKEKLIITLKMKIKLMENIEMEKIIDNQINHWVNIWEENGKKEGIKRIVLNLFNHEMTPDKISEMCDLPLSEVKKIISER